MNTPDRPLPDYIEEVSDRTGVRLGVPLPMGTHAYGGGVNFAFFSRHATRVRLELFNRPEDAVAARVIDLDPACNRTGDVWHVSIEGIRLGQHNAANGENNHDGTDDNLSENYGAEGDTTDAGIEAVRKVQIKNFLLTLLISRGVPMLLGSDEFRRTQGGNNNTYCQDNETSWYDWSYLEKHKDIFRFTRGMIAFRRAHPILTKEQFYTDAEIHWFSPRRGLPNWADPNARQFACLIQEDQPNALYLMFNAGAGAVDFALPLIPPDVRWRLAVDTSREAPNDLFGAGEEPPLEDPQTYHLSPRSSAILLAR